MRPGGGREIGKRVSRGWMGAVRAAEEGPSAWIGAAWAAAVMKYERRWRRRRACWRDESSDKDISHSGRSLSNTTIDRTGIQVMRTAPGDDSESNISKVYF